MFVDFTRDRKSDKAVLVGEECAGLPTALRAVKRVCAKHGLQAKGMYAGELVDDLRNDLLRDQFLHTDSDMTNRTCEVF